VPHNFKLRSLPAIRRRSLPKLLNSQKEVQSKYRLKRMLPKAQLRRKKYWTVRRESFNLLRQHTHGLSTAPFIDDIIVHTGDLPKFFLPELTGDFKQISVADFIPLRPRGRRQLHIIPLMDLTKADQRMLIQNWPTRFTVGVKVQRQHYCGPTTGLSEALIWKKCTGPRLPLYLKRVKEIFDPKNIFNPNKKVGTTLDYAMAHIKKRF